MEIKCATCGKDVTPLELYDGSWTCPVCRNPINDKLGKFMITKDNDELFRQSELLYSKWLFNHDGSASMTLIDRAVNLCRQSVGLGNPKALARLAYFYDKGYIGGSGSRMMRYKMAYNYYTAICFNSLSEVDTEEGADPVDWKRMKEETAYALLYMLSTAPEEIRTGKLYNLKDAIDRAQNELGMTFNLDQSYNAEEQTTAASRVFDVFCSCIDKHRAPLFGAFLLRVGDIIELYKKPLPGKEDKVPYALYWLTTNKKVLFSYIKSEDVSDSDAMFSRLSTQSSVEGMIDKYPDEEYVWTFFFNNNGGHKYLSQKKRDKVEKIIYGRVGTDLLKTMLQNGNRKSYTFYDDDIYQFMKQNNVGEAVNTLIDKICNGSEEI